MNAGLARRLAALEERNPPPGEAPKFYMVYPWEHVPDAREQDMVCLVRIVAPNGEYGGETVSYERTGVHPSADAPGSWNRHLYYGEPLNA